MFNSFSLARPFLLPKSEETSQVWVSRATFINLFGSGESHASNYVQIGETVYRIGVNEVIPRGRIGMNEIQLNDCRQPVPQLTLIPFPAEKVERIAKLTLQLSTDQPGKKSLDVDQLTLIVKKILSAQILREKQSVSIPLSIGFFKAEVLSLQCKDTVTSLEFNQMQFFGKFDESTALNFEVEKYAPIELVGRMVAMERACFEISPLSGSSPYLDPKDREWRLLLPSFCKWTEEPSPIDIEEIRNSLREQPCPFNLGQTIKVNVNPLLDVNLTLKSVFPALPRESPPQRYAITKASHLQFTTNGKMRTYDSKIPPCKLEKTALVILDFTPRFVDRLKNNNFFWEMELELLLPKNRIIMPSRPFILPTPKGHFLMELDQPVPFGKERYLLSQTTKLFRHFVCSPNVFILHSQTPRTIKKITWILIQRRDATKREGGVIIDSEIEDIIRKSLTDLFVKSASLQFSLGDLQLELIIQEMIDQTGETIGSLVPCKLDKETQIEIKIEDLRLSRPSASVKPPKTKIERKAEETPKEKPFDLKEALLKCNMVVSPEFLTILRKLHSTWGSLEKFPDKTGIQPASSLLIYGPSGTGKSTLARNFGTFFSTPHEPHIIYPNEYDLQMIKNALESKDHHLFIIDDIDEALNAKAPEKVRKGFIDAMQRKRDNVMIVGFTQEKKQITQAALEMFDFKLELPLPSKVEKKEIFKLHTRNLVEMHLLSNDVDLDRLTELMGSWSGAKIHMLIRNATLRAYDRLEQLSLPPEQLEKHPDAIVTMNDFLQALEELEHSMGIVPPPPPINIDQFLNHSGLAGISGKLKEVIRSIVLGRGPMRHILRKRGIKPVKGLLLYGPPGTGKTCLAREIGKLLGCHGNRLVQKSGSEFMNRYYGESEKAVREIFAFAKAEAIALEEKSGTHMIIIDEADALLRKRGTSESGQTYDNVVNQFLTEVDGLFQYDNLVVVLISNKKELIDEAVLRPGRVEVHLEMGLPNRQEREEILELSTSDLHASNLLAPDINFAPFLDQMEGWSGAVIKGLVRGANNYALERLAALHLPEDQLENHPAGILTHEDFAKAFAALKNAVKRGGYVSS